MNEHSTPAKWSSYFPMLSRTSWITRSGEDKGENKISGRLFNRMAHFNSILFEFELIAIEVNV
jgi:hypothetical protein